MAIKLPPREPRPITETDVLKRILEALAHEPGVRAARNNVGTLTDLRGIPVTYGLGNGSPDVVGIMTFGRALPIAIAFGVEVKKPGKKAEPHQRAWHAVAKRRGMYVGVATSEEEAVTFVRSLRDVMRRAIMIVGGNMSRGHE